jgi:hypothetical protein
MSDMFQRPSSGDHFKAADHLGKLVLFETIGGKEMVKTNFGDTEAVTADVTVIDADGGPQTYPRSLVFGAALIGTLTRALPGKPLLGRIGQGQAKAGQSAPWVLADYSDQDAQLAGQYLTQRASGTFQAPSQTAPATPAAPAMQSGQAGSPNLNDPAVQAALAALAAGGLTTPTPDQPGF